MTSGASAQNRQHTDSGKGKTGLTRIFYLSNDFISRSEYSDWLILTLSRVYSSDSDISATSRFHYISHTNLEGGRTDMPNSSTIFNMSSQKIGWSDLRNQFKQLLTQDH